MSHVVYHDINCTCLRFTVQSSPEASPWVYGQAYCTLNGGNWLGIARHVQISILCHPNTPLRTSLLTILAFFASRQLLANTLNLWRLSETLRVRVSAREPMRDVKWRG